MPNGLPDLATLISQMQDYGDWSVGTMERPDSPEYAAYKRLREKEKENERHPSTYTWEETATQGGIPISDKYIGPQTQQMRESGLKTARPVREGYDPNIRNPWEQAPGSESPAGTLGTPYNNPRKRGVAVTETTGPMSKFSSSPFWGPSARETTPLIPGSDPDMFTGMDQNQRLRVIPPESTVQGAHIPGLLRYIIQALLRNSARQNLPPTSGMGW